jgi:hypothetical protein
MGTLIPDESDADMIDIESRISRIIQWMENGCWNKIGTECVVDETLNVSILH